MRLFTKDGQMGDNVDWVDVSGQDEQATENVGYLRNPDELVGKLTPSRPCEYPSQPPSLLASPDALSKLAKGQPSALGA